MTPTLIQDSAGSVVLFVETMAGVPATGLADTDVTADIKKEGDASFSSFTLSPTNWTELSGGYYEIDFAAVNTDTLGNLYLRVQGATIKTTLIVAYVIASAPVNPPTVTPPNTVAVFGYVYGSDASPLSGASVTAKIIGVPTVLHPGEDGLLISQDSVVVYTDAYGFFSISLIAGTTVDIIISAAGYRRSILVPSTSTNLFDIV